MRVADRPLPTSIVLDPGALAAWPVRPVFAIEQAPLPPYVWDDGSLWDTGPVWDAATVLASWGDATCDFTGCEIEYGPPDDNGNVPATRCVLQLDNRSGRWGRYNIDGTPAAYGPGSQLWIWADEAAGPGAWWLFAGRIARYDERADDTIEIEAFDYFSDLAQPVGTYTAGANNDLPAARLTSIVAIAAATLLTRFAAGTVHLTAQPTDDAPLEQMQTVTGSDGGVLYGDADGTIVSTDRTWRTGRSDQTAVPTVSTNVCSAPIVLWDPELTTSDAGVAGRVVLENIAHLKATATAATPGPFVLAVADQQWTTQAEGDLLAADLVAQMWQPRLAIETADLYLTDPAHNLWAALDWRRFDRIRILHDSRTPGGVSRVDVLALIAHLSHSITPDGWVMSFGTTRALSYFAPIFWDSNLAWDDGSVWGY